MNFLLAGSLAYDTILIHSGEFHHKILPEEISRLNVAFGIQSVSEQFGGTAGNIAYNSALLNNYPILIYFLNLVFLDNLINLYLLKHLQHNNLLKIF